jgi:hypothetical protein
MKRACWLLLAAGSVLPTAAGGMELSLTPNWEDTGDAVEVGLSQTAVVSVYLNIGADDGNLSFADIFFDATPINDPETAGYDVVGREFRMERNDGSGWFGAEEWNGRSEIEDYRLIAGDGDDPIGTNGPWVGHLDGIIIHGTEIGSYDLYFENQYTSEGDPRPPRLRDGDGFDLPEPHFRNAWRDDERGFDVPFKVRVVPEPSSLALIVVAAVGLLGKMREK